MEENIELIRVSVVIPMYNAEQTIERALSSVLRQNFNGRIEILVINDGSTDNSAELVEQFSNSNPSMDIKLFNQENGGVSKARNKGLSHASGDYIAFLDSDDEWLNDKLITQLKFLESGLADFVTTLRNSDKLSYPYKIIEGEYAKVSLRKLLIKVVGQTSTALFRKELITRIGFFDEEQRYSEDAQFWMRMAQNSNMIILNKVFVITGGGKPSVGYSGLSANLIEMEKGVQKNILDMYRLNYINYFEYIIFKMYSNLKYKIRLLNYSK
ncbi:glycosyltransferase family 2 protein [Sphingobacterium multivorum]|uniref:glycosyltransferase family 2 protein n=1 Tax=Sphingobacterium multivorum TaxID=28454 RepID=UPI003DA2D870